MRNEVAGARASIAVEWMNTTGLPPHRACVAMKVLDTTADLAPTAALGMPAALTSSRDPLQRAHGDGDPATSIHEHVAVPMYSVPTNGFAVAMVGRITLSARAAMAGMESRASVAPAATGSLAQAAAQRLLAARTADELAVAGLPDDGADVEGHTPSEDVTVAGNDTRDSLCSSGGYMSLALHESVLRRLGHY